MMIPGMKMPCFATNALGLLVMTTIATSQEGSGQCVDLNLRCSEWAPHCADAGSDLRLYVRPPDPARASYFSYAPDGGGS